MVLFLGWNSPDSNGGYCWWATALFTGQEHTLLGAKIWGWAPPLGWIGNGGEACFGKSSMKLHLQECWVNPPDILLIHLGCIDLARRSDKSIVLDILRDLQNWKAKYP